MECLELNREWGAAKEIRDVKPVNLSLAFGRVCSTGRYFQACADKTQQSGNMRFCVKRKRTCVYCIGRFIAM